MSRLLLSLFVLLFAAPVAAQLPLRPDAFPAVDDRPVGEGKALLMASDSATMADWMHYPTYDYYVTMMQRYAQRYPALCRLDTIGTSVGGRLILCVRLTNTAVASAKPQVFYSSTMHGDELVGFHHMLHLIDTLLGAYGASSQITDLLNSTEVYINPCSNPDGTYYGNAYFGGNGTVQYARRNNANNVDLNRNYPDPFDPVPAKSLEPENAAMIDYVSRHQFRLAANLHSGSEVMNYPWDSFTSSQRQHPHADWWVEVSKRFVDTCRQVAPSMFTDVLSSGYITGGDWYVISGGRQDYMNEVQGVLELTMELSSTKKLASADLPYYWRSQCQALIDYIGEVRALPGQSAIDAPSAAPLTWRVYPNPTRGVATVVTDRRTVTLDLSHRSAGMYFFLVDGRWVRVVKY